MSVVGHRLVIARTMRGVTAAFIATRAGITPAMMSTYETGVAVPKVEGLIRLADALDVDLDFLAGRTSKPRSDSKNACGLKARISSLSEADRRLTDVFLDTLEARRYKAPIDPMLKLKVKIEEQRERQRRERESN